jgi:hypothetical protein
MRCFVCAAFLVAMLAYSGASYADEKKSEKKGNAKPAPKTVDIGKQAPKFKIKASDGKVIDLARPGKAGRSLRVDRNRGPLSC